MIRFPQGMRDRIRSRANENHRSMNAEIVHCLDQILDEHDKKSSAEVATSPSAIIHQTL